MQVTTFAPGARIAPFVRRFTFVETEEEATRVLVPEPGVIVGIRYRGSAAEWSPSGSARRLPDATVAGMRLTARTMKTSPGGGIILATFRETAAARFFSTSLHEIFGSTVALRDVVPASAADRVASQVAEAADSVQRAAAMERFILERMTGYEPDPLVHAAVRVIRASHGAVRIAHLAHSLGISQERLEKRFRRAVGASPKQFASMLRLRHAVKRWQPGESLTRLSAEAGYYDQPHFTREFRSVVGHTPRAFFGRVAFC